MNQIDVMKQALELLQLIWQHGLQQSSITEHETAIKKLSKAIEEADKCECSLKLEEQIAEAEKVGPVAYMSSDNMAELEFVDAHFVRVAKGQFPFDNPIPLYTTPPQAAEKVEPINIDWLSNVIRAVDGNNTLGAGELAEKIVAHILLIRGTPQREWVGLTDEEIIETCNGADFKSMVTADDYLFVIYHAFEAKLKEKNT